MPRYTENSASYIESVQLCRLVKNFECLYETTNSDYLNRREVENAWFSIANSLNKTVAYCRKRWRNICMAYTGSFRKGETTYYLHEELKFYKIIPRIAVIEKKPLISNNDLDSDVPVKQEKRRVKIPKPELQPKRTLEETECYVQVVLHDVETELLEHNKNNHLIDSDENEEKPIPQFHINTDEDDVFWNSLKPHLNIMSARQKEIFKEKIIKSLTEIFEQSDHLRATAKTTKKAALNKKNHKAVANSNKNPDPVPMVKVRRLTQSSYNLNQQNQEILIQNQQTNKTSPSETQKVKNNKRKPPKNTRKGRMPSKVAKISEAFEQVNVEREPSCSLDPNAPEQDNTQTQHLKENYRQPVICASRQIKGYSAWLQ